MQECAFVEKWRHKWNLAAITELSEYCKAGSLGCNGYSSRNTGEFPFYDVSALDIGKAENGQTE